MQAVGFLAGMSFRIIRVRNRERIFLLFLFCYDVLPLILYVDLIINICYHHARNL